MKALVFDFNGTMFLDTDKQRLAWNEFFQKYIGRPLTEEEFLRYACGPALAPFCAAFTARTSMTPRRCSWLRKRKRCTAASAARTRGTSTSWKACPRRSTACARRACPMAIATGAGRPNLEFYFEAFGLGRWFDWAHILYDDGTLPGKPAPDIYLRVCALLGVAPQDAIVVEDSFAGIESANAAGVGGIIAITATNPAEKLAALPGVKAIIDDYRSFDAVLARLA